jgi:hypothetical protein
VFFDLAVRGCKSDRAGLNGLCECLLRRAATVAFFFATNRLFRKAYRALQFVEERVIEVGAAADHVRAAHEGPLERRLVFGTVSFGYTGRSVPGQNARRGRPRTDRLLVQADEIRRLG